MSLYHEWNSPLRLCQLAFGTIVVGFGAQFFCVFDGYLDRSRLIYTEVVACLSILLAFILLIKSFDGHYLPSIIDFLMFAAWISAFASMVNQVSPVHCGELWYLDHLTRGDTCNYWKVTISFAFASGVAWLLSAIRGVVSAHHAAATTANPNPNPIHIHHWP